MSREIEVHKNRTNTVLMALGIDVSGDTLTSEIRVSPDTSSLLIATWTVNFVTDGSDGELVLTMDDAITSAITHSNGYMDVKRISGGEPLSAFDYPLEVTFIGSVTQ